MELNEKMNSEGFEEEKKANDQKTLAPNVSSTVPALKPAAQPGKGKDETSSLGTLILGGLLLIGGYLWYKSENKEDENSDTGSGRTGRKKWRTRKYDRRSQGDDTDDTDRDDSTPGPFGRAFLE